MFQAANKPLVKVHLEPSGIIVVDFSLNNTLTLAAMHEAYRQHQALCSERKSPVLMLEDSVMKVEYQAQHYASDAKICHHVCQRPCYKIISCTPSGQNVVALSQATLSIATLRRRKNSTCLTTTISDRRLNAFKSIAWQRLQRLRADLLGPDNNHFADQFR